MIKFQDELLHTIDAFDDLPHSILLVGDQGSGHDDICNYISNKFNINICDITEFISLDYINEINLSVSKTLYCIDMNLIDERKQNIILKLYEEPSAYAYIILKCEHDDLVLDTIKSRSYILKFKRFSREQLNEYIHSSANKDLILNVCTTPGQIEIANNTDINNLYLLCDTILKSLNSANFQNTLSIVEKINFKDEYSKFDLSLFLKVLKYELINNNVNNKILICDLINKCSRYINSMNNKKQYFENFLIELWKISKLV